MTKAHSECHLQFSSLEKRQYIVLQNYLGLFFPQHNVQPDQKQEAG